MSAVRAQTRRDRGRLTGHDLESAAAEGVMPFS